MEALVYMSEYGLDAVPSARAGLFAWRIWPLWPVTQ